MTAHRAARVILRTDGSEIIGPPVVIDLDRSPIRELIPLDGVSPTGPTCDIILRPYPDAILSRLDDRVWTYWVDRDDTFRVYFDGDRVSRVSRHDDAPRGARRRRRN